MVQWLRLCDTSAEGLGLIPGLGTRSHMPQLRPSIAKKKKDINSAMLKCKHSFVLSLLPFYHSESESEVPQSCLTLCDLMDCSLSHSSIHEIFAGKSTGVGCHFLLQRIFPTQGSNPGLPHCRQTLYCLSHQGSLFYHSIYDKVLF